MRFPGFHEIFQDFNRDFRISTKISHISRKISGFQRRFPDFAKDSRFHERFQAKCIYEISVSGGPLGYTCYFENSISAFHYY